MRLGLRSKLLIGSVLLVVLSHGTIYALARRDLEERVLADAERDLSTEARLVAVRAEDWWEANPHPSFQELADAVIETSHLRLSIVRADGVVLGDSSVPRPELDALDNHKTRPEIRQALLGETGVARRRSRTTERDSLYVAVPIRAADRKTVVGAVRLALDLDVLDEQLGRLERDLLGGAAGALGVALAIAMVLAITWSRQIRALTRTAQRMADGELTAQIPELSDAELRGLGGALGRLARSLSTTLSELRSERDRLERILEGMQEGVVAVDQTCTVLLENPAFCALCRPHERSFVEPSARVRSHPEVLALFEEAMQKDEPVSRQIELGELSRSIWLAWVAPSRGPEGGAFGVFFDVTDMRRLESVRRDFVANVSHELRTPITAIRSASETLEGGAAEDAEARQAFLGIISRNAERLGSLVDDILELARIETQKARLVLEPLEVNSLIRGVVTLFEERVAKKSITLSVALDEPAAYVEADRRALEQVLSNLLDNALKYSGPGALVVVSGKVEAQSVIIGVEDTGPGIPEQHLPRIFERFYRVDRGRSRDVGGTGLGLSIVKHLVESMGSTIRVMSELNVGTRFWFSLPKLPPPPP